METFGIKSSKVRKNSLVVGDKKFSGQAFCHRRDRTLHHGTQLINCDLNRLGRYLGPELDGIETKAIASVPAEVANLSGVTTESLSAALIETFKEMYETGPVEYWGDGEVENATQLLPMIGKNSSKDWKLGHTPKFTFGNLEVEKGRVVNLEGTPFFEDFLKTRNL